MDEETMATRLKRLRAQKNWSLEVVAQQLGVTRAAVHKWENGDTTNMKNETFVLLCDLYGTDPQYLLWGEDRSPKTPPPFRTPPGSATGRFRIIKGKS